MSIAKSGPSEKAPQEPATGDLVALEAECAALRAELARTREESDRQIRQLNAQLSAALLEHERAAGEIETLQKIESERDRLRSWIEVIEQDLCSAQSHVRDLESRIEGLSRVNARLSLERAELKARLDVLGGGAPSRAAPALERRISELESDLARLTAENALHQESTAEVRSLRMQLETSARRQAEIERALAQSLEALAASEDVAADAVTELDLLRGLMARSAESRPDPAGEEMQPLRRVAELEAELADLRRRLQETRESASRE